MKHHCGIFGIHNHPDAARLTYFGLYALLHRGQEGAGIASFDGKQMHEHRGMGLVPDIFTEEHLSHLLKGHAAIGHTRYSSAGQSQIRNALPFVVTYKDQDIAISHNGNLTNAEELRAELEDSGAISQTTTNSELIVHLIVRSLASHTIEEAIVEACKRIKGAYSLVILVNDTLIAVRDPYGFHPLSLGRMGTATVIASETCAFDLLEAEFIRSLEPGEMVTIQGARLNSRFLDFDRNTTPVRQCIFELVYFARPDSIIFGEDVYQCRKRMGAEIAREAPASADFVMPFPDSGVYSAVGFAHESGLPYEHAMIRNHYVGRTFIQPSQGMRDFGVRVKINPVRSMIKGKRICIVDDSIVRGTTIRTRVQKLRELGAAEIHFRVSCPPVKFPCFYGINFSSKGELIAANYTEQEIGRFLGLDSLHYLSTEGILRSVSNPDAYCLACFTGDYPVPNEISNKLWLERKRMSLSFLALRIPRLYR